MEEAVVLEVRVEVATRARGAGAGRLQVNELAAPVQDEALQAKMAAWPHTRQILERNLPRASLSDLS